VSSLLTTIFLLHGKGSIVNDRTHCSPWQHRSSIPVQTQHRSSIPVQPLAEEQPGAARPVDLRCLMKAAGNGLWRSSNADKTEEVLRVIDLASVEMEVCLHTYADGAKRLYIYMATMMLQYYHG